MSLATLTRYSWRFLPLASLFFSALLFSSCSHYRMGTGGETKFKTLFIAPVASTALIPQAQALVTTQLREAFLKDSRVSLVNSAAGADAVLHITLYRYNRELAVSQPTDTGLGRRFDVSLDARATLTNNRTQEVYFTDRLISAKRGAFTDSGLVPAEYQLLPLLAEQLASESVHATLDVW